MKELQIKLGGVGNVYNLPIIQINTKQGNIFLQVKN